MSEKLMEEYECINAVDNDLHVINIAIQAIRRHILKDGLNEYPDNAANRLKRVGNYIQSYCEDESKEWEV